MTNVIGNLPNFDHDVQEWPIFKGRLLQFIKLNSVKAENKSALLLTHLSDGSYRLARNLLHPDVLEEVKFEDLVKELDKHFTPKRCTFADREKFFEARRSDGESVEEWAARIRGLAVHCEFGEALDMLLRDRFILGLAPCRERDRLFEEDATKLTFAKALEVAQQAAYARLARAATAAVAETAAPTVKATQIKEEPVYRISGQRARREPAAATRSSNDSSGEIRRCTVCGLRNHNTEKCRYKNYRCQECGVKGHLKKVCSKKKVESRLHCLNTEETTSDQSDCEECKLFNLRYISNAPIIINVLIDHVTVDMELDSGSGASVISENLYKKYFLDRILVKSNLKMCLYNGHKISPLGYFRGRITYLNNSHDIKIFVLPNGGPPLLGRDFMSKFKLYFTTDINNIQTIPTGITKYDKKTVQQLLSKYSDLFTGELGRFNKFEVKLVLKDGTKPKFFKPRSVPFALKKKVEQEIDRLVGLGILQPIKFPKYGTPIVPVLKENGQVKIAGDYSITLNKDLEIDKYPMPRIEEVFAKLGGGESYSKLDLSNAYNQFVLDKQSQGLTTISTSKGFFKYTRLVYGLANAPAIFQRAMESLLIGIEGVSIWLDDVCVTAPTSQLHFSRLNEVLSRLKDAGLKLQKEKCSFFQESVTYLGYIINKNGLRACKKKTEAITNAPRPTSVTEVKRFLGLINYYRNFIPNASAKLHPLHDLLRKGASWEWSERHERAFNSVKIELSSERVLAHFDPAAQLVLTVDAGPAGLGAVLAQRDRVHAHLERPLAFASRSLSASERNYSQIQKEATAIIFGVKYFHQYLYGRQEPFVLKTDHRPLLSIFGKKTGISVMAASRLQRYAIILSAYNYNVQYIKSDNNVAADYLSRAPLPEPDCTIQADSDLSFLNFLDANVAPLTFADIKIETERDATLKTVIKHMQNGWPRKINCKLVLPYFNCKTDLELENGCIFRGHRVVIPAVYRNRLLKELHSGHFGVVKTKSAARSRFWWPSIDKDIEEWVGACYSCAGTRAAPPRAPPAPWPRDTAPWQRLHIDYMTINQRVYLIVVDSFSKWLECLHMSCGTSSRALIVKLKELFSRFGIPSVIVSDNDVKIKSNEFKYFCEMNGIRYITSPIYHPSSNGQAENSVKTCKKMLQSIINDNCQQNVINEKLLGFLFDYRNTPHCATGECPAKLMFGRNIKSRLDLLLPNRNNNTTGYNNIQPNKRITIGDKVWLRWYIARKEIWTLGNIIRIVGNRMYEIQVKDYNVKCTRHIDQIRKYTGGNVTGSETTEARANVMRSPTQPAPSPPRLCSPTAAAAEALPDRTLVSDSGSQVIELEGNNVEEEDEWAEAESVVDPNHHNEPNESNQVVAKDRDDCSIEPQPTRLIRSCRRKINYKE